MTGAAAAETVRIAGARLEVVRIAGPSEGASVIVFLHEGLGSVSQWRDYPHRLCSATGCGALIYSRRGYGASSPHAEPPGTGYLRHEALDVLPALLDRYAVERPILYGHSDGASIALIHAGDSGRGVRALVLEAPHVFVEPVSLAGVRAARSAFEAGALKDSLARHHADPEHTFRSWCDAWLDPAFAAWNIEPCLDRITAPALLIQGDGDRYGTLRQLDAIARGVRGSCEMLVLPDCGHGPHREAPEQVLTAASRFLRKVIPQRGHEVPPAARDPE